MRKAPLATVPCESVEKLWKGSIDMHIHPAPDPSVTRRLNSLECALDAQAAGMRAIVIKSFFYPTTALALAARHVAPEVKVFGSLVVGGKTTGGLDYAAETIENHAKLGCKVLWFPAFDAECCHKGLGLEGGINILDAERKLKAQAHEILGNVKKYNMVLCSGHMSYAETSALFMEAAKIGIDKMVLTHPLVKLWETMSLSQIKELADLGAYIEHVYGQVLPRNGSLDPREYVEVIEAVGAERCIMSTDLGQIMDCTPAEGMRSHIAMLLQFGCTEREVELMAKSNPARLLDLD